VQAILLASLIGVTVLLNTIAQTLLKLGANQSPLNFYALAGIISYGLSTLFYLLVLGKMNLSIVYPIVIGLTIIATTLSSGVILRETISSSQWLGIGLMLSAISAIALGKLP
jgi:small multidrug resistance pump